MTTSGRGVLVVVVAVKIITALALAVVGVREVVPALAVVVVAVVALVEIVTALLYFGVAGGSDDWHSAAEQARTGCHIPWRPNTILDLREPVPDFYHGLQSGARAIATTAAV